MIEVEPYRPNPEIRTATQDDYDDYQHCLNLRNQTYPEFDDMTPDDYWNQARQVAKNYLPPIKDNQLLSQMFIGKIRNKMNQIGAFVAAQRPRVDIDVRGGYNTRKTDKRLAMLLRTTYNFFMDKEDADQKYVKWTMEALSVGTGILQEDYDFRVRDVKLIENEDFGDGVQKWKTEQRVYKDQPTANIVPVEDLFIPNFYEPDIQEQPYIIIREYVPRIIAQQRYGNFANWKYVPTDTSFTKEEKEGKTFFYTILQDRVEDNNVEIIHKMDKWNDIHRIYCNGVLMNDVDTPIKFDHKNYPFIPTIYEELGVKFFYGMAIGMKAISEVEALNELGNNNLDRSRISSVPKAISNYESDIEYNTVGAFEIIQSSVENDLKEFRFESVKPGDMQYMELIASYIDEATVDRSFSGVVTGATATEIMNARAQNIQSLGLFLTYMYSAAKVHAEMRLQNLLQYFFMTHKKYMGSDFETREISVQDKLQDGSDGVRIIRILSSKDKIPHRDEQKKEKERGVVVKKDSKGKEVERKVEVNYDILYVTPQEIADIVFTVTIVPGSSLPETESLRKALLLEMTNTLTSEVFVQFNNLEKLNDMIIEEFGYIPEDIKKESGDPALMDAQNPDPAAMVDPMAAMMGGGGEQEGGVQPGAGGENSELVQQIAGTQKPSAQDLLTQPQ